MTGSAKQAIKKLLSPHQQPVDDIGVASPPDASSPNQNEHSEHSLTHAIRSSLSLKSHKSPEPHSRPSDMSLGSVQSNSSIASNPGNYLTDAQLKEDLAVEAMIEREGKIGKGDQRLADGVPDLSPSGHRAPPPPPSQHSGEIQMSTGHHGALPPPHLDPLPPAVASPPPPGTVSPPAAGGMYKNAWGNGGGAGGRGGKKSSKQKFEERQARKKEALINSAPPTDPDWTAQLERERQEEIKVVSDACTVLGREIHEIPPDGHCMYTAIADQLAEIGLAPAHQATNPQFTRHEASKYMLDHPDDFMAFLPSVQGEDTAAATEHEGLMTEKEFSKYCKNVRETGEWGGEPEIQALSRAFGVPIHVIQRGPPTIVSHGGSDESFGGVMTPEQSKAAGDRVVRISYHRRMYGLGEHYNSLRKVR